MKISFNHLWSRAYGRYQRTASNYFFKRTKKMRNKVPYISFTFDDFPRSALHAGGKILIGHDLKGSYYASFKLINSHGASGPLFRIEDIRKLIAQGHELGCHTYAHCHSWETRSREFEKSIIKNRQVLYELFPENGFRTFSYPISGPRPGTKRRVGKYFECCRGGGQDVNVGTVDLNHLNAFFIEKCRDNPQKIYNIIEANRRVRGWLIIATHDIAEHPTPFGCTPSLFEEIVKYALASGAEILTVADALDAIFKGKNDNSR